MQDWYIFTKERVLTVFMHKLGRLLDDWIKVCQERITAG